MAPFKLHPDSTALWEAFEGDPDSNAGHRTVLVWLRRAAQSTFLKAGQPFLPAIKGNLGEFIAYRVIDAYRYPSGALVFSANTATPLDHNSSTGVDIVWLYFGNSPNDDWAALQEVKTTGDSSLSLALELEDDYKKLFGENPRLTLQTRLGALKNELEQQNQGHLAKRVTGLGGPNAASCRGIELRPTLIHDAQHSAAQRMEAVRVALVGLGWPAASVTCFTIALDDLDSRLFRLARGLP